MSDVYLYVTVSFMSSLHLLGLCMIAERVSEKAKERKKNTRKAHLVMISEANYEFCIYS